MKPYQRRAAAAYPFYKLATFNRQSLTFHDGKKSYATETEATAAATAPGKYRLSVVTEDGRTDREPFCVG